MAFTLYSLMQAALLCVNAIAVLHEERFLKNIGWGTDQGIGGFGEEPGIKSQLMNLIRSVRTVMRVPLIIVNSVTIVLLFYCGSPGFPCPPHSLANCGLFSLREAQGGTSGASGLRPGRVLCTTSALGFPEDGGPVRVRRRAQPRGGGLGNGDRAPAGGHFCEPVGENTSASLENRAAGPGLPESCSGDRSSRPAQLCSLVGGASRWDKGGRFYTGDAQTQKEQLKLSEEVIPETALKEVARREEDGEGEGRVREAEGSAGCQEPGCGSEPKSVAEVEDALWALGTKPVYTKRSFYQILVSKGSEESREPGKSSQGLIGLAKKLRAASVMVRFVTNTTKESKQDLLERLKKLEFEISEDEIFTSLTAARNLVEQKQVRPMLLVDDRALPDFTGVQTGDPNAVVIGLAPEHFHYQLLNQAFRLLLDGAPLIAIHKARYYKRKDGLALGPGPFVTALEYATDTKATVVGKPEKTFFLEALRDTGCAPEEAVMIGDDCRDDVGGAQNTGMLGILVRTGKYRAADEEKINPPPYLTCESFPHAVDHILQHLL
ncbi:uncharacterized protein LOC127204297 [Acomys russatus]|uniref:uncharacterized protein LOC127204297 n=1 Tax=Acomys russatus TaxID=60746 RepID=UPI0021E1F54A|nr:uncharacterized protein LOC127204297 [Acomys russatus]